MYLDLFHVLILVFVHLLILYTCIYVEVPDLLDGPTAHHQKWGRVNQIWDFAPYATPEYATARNASGDTFVYINFVHIFSRLEGLSLDVVVI